MPSHKKDLPPSPPPAIELADVGVVDITDAPDDIEERRRLPLMEDLRGVIAWISVAVRDNDDFPDDAFPDDEEALTSIEEGRV